MIPYIKTKTNKLQSTVLTHKTYKTDVKPNLSQLKLKPNLLTIYSPFFCNDKELFHFRTKKRWEYFRERERKVTDKNSQNENRILTEAGFCRPKRKHSDDVITLETVMYSWIINSFMYSQCYVMYRVIYVMYYVTWFFWISNSIFAEWYFF